MPPRIAVLALGAANYANIFTGLARAGGTPFAARAANDLDGADALVIPGVANVGFLIDALDATGMRRPLLEAIERGMPALGVCAGFQLCFESSDEAPQRRGLAIFAGHVAAMRAPKLPHLGWNRVESLARSFGSGWAYFAHSFATPANAPQSVAQTTHRVPFASAARKGNVLGVQFHPERSGAFGASLLATFVREAARRC
jgi:imidazole glycerol phosphate synthase glutamine amidotransferase subunit